jgi:hypothetical protein
MSNVVIFGETGTNTVPVSVDATGNINVNVVSGGGGGSGGIIQGQNIDGNLGINISADTKIQSTETINRLYTHSSLYAEYTDGFNQTSDLALNCDATGKLNVNVVGGSSFDGVIKGISTSGTNPSVNFSAEVITPPAGGNTINKLYTHSSLFGYNDITEQEKQVGVNSDGQMSVLVGNTALAVNVSDGAGLALSSTAQTVGTGNANFLNTYSRMIGSTNGTDYKTALMDTGGRLQVSARISDSAGGGLGSTAIGTIKCLNVVDLNQSYTGTNLNVNVANTATTNSNIRDGAGTLLTSTNVGGAGGKQGLDVNIIGGGGGGGGGGVVQLQAYDSADPLVPMNVQTTANRLLVNSNIIDAVDASRKLVVNLDGSINVAGSSSVVQGINTDGGLAVDIKATDNRLLTNSLLIGQTGGGTPTQHAVITNGAGNLIVEAKCHDGVNNPIASTVVGTDRALDVYVLGNNPNLKGSYNNIANNLTFLASLAFTTPLSLNNEYGNESVISYQDGSTLITSFISIYGSLDTLSTGNYFYIGVLQPALIRPNFRQASAVLKLKGLKWIKIGNEHNNNVSFVNCTLISGE